MGIIYKHTLLADCEHKGGSYIGQTCKIDYTRRGMNGYGYAPRDNKKPTIFGNAICKYGGENFSHEILEENIATAEEADEREKYGIAYYHTGIEGPQCAGYNMTSGGISGQLGRIKLINDLTHEIKGGHIEYLETYILKGFRQWTQADLCKKGRAENKERLRENARLYNEKNRQKRNETARKCKQRRVANMTPEEKELARLKHNEANRKYQAKKKRREK